MAAPSPRAGSPTPTASPTADSTTFTVTLAPHATGDTLFVFIAQDGATGTMSCAGWTLIRSAPSTTSNGHIFRRDTVAASNAEANPVFSSTASEQYAAMAYSVPGTALLDCESFSASGTSGTPDAPTLAPTGGTQDYLWIVFYAFDGNAGIATPPSGYGSELAISNAGGQTASAITAFKTSMAVSSENPGTAATTNEQWVAFTIGIWDSGSPPPPPVYTGNPAARLLGLI